MRCEPSLDARARCDDASPVYPLPRTSRTVILSFPGRCLSTEGDENLIQVVAAKADFALGELRPFLSLVWEARFGRMNVAPSLREERW